MKKSSALIDSLILSIRSQKVILDSDLAELYGVPTKVFNQAIKRNLERFPIDFMFQLTAAEWSLLKSQVATTSSEHVEDKKLEQSRSQSVTSSSKYRGASHA